MLINQYSTLTLGACGSMIGNRDLQESDAIQREEALKRIAALIKSLNLTPDEIVETLSLAGKQPLIELSASSSRSFDPFFDAW